LFACAADLLSSGSRNRQVVADRPITGGAAGFLPSSNGYDMFQGQQSGIVARGVTPVPGSSLQHSPSSPLTTDVSIVD